MDEAILHLIDTGGPGGAETIFADLLAISLEGRYRSIPVVPERAWLAHEVEERGLSPIVLGTRNSFDTSYLRALVRLVRAQRVRVIQSHLWTSAVYASLAGRITGVPVVCTFHGVVDVEESGWRLRSKTQIIDRRSNRAVFVSESLRRELSNTLRLSRAEAVTIPNGIDLNRYRPSDGRAFREALGLPPDVPLIGAIGNVRPAKDYFTLLRAFAELRSRLPRATLVIAGDTKSPLFTSLSELKTELGLDDAVHFLGFREDTEFIFAALDLFVLASRSEGFSLVCLQALACGVPVVSTRCGGPETILEDNVSGLLSETGNAPALAESMYRVLSDSAFANRLRRAGRSVAAIQYSRSTMLERYANLYAETMGVSRPPAPVLTAG